MGTRRNKQSTESESDEKQKRPRRAKSKAELVEKAIHSIEDKLESNDFKATLGDFIRLLELQKKLQVDQPREVKVTWVEPSETELAFEK